MFPFTTDQHSLCSSSVSKYSSVFDSCKCRDNITLIESAITNDPSTALSSSSSIKQHSTNSYLNNINNNNNENSKIVECVHDNNLCPFINSVHPCHRSFDDRNKYNICNMNYEQEYEHCSSVFSEDNFLHRHTCNELGKLYEMTEDEKDHETPETMIDEGSNNNSIRLSDINYHHSFISLSSPSIHVIANMFVL
uniref:SJCHGC03682 protein n=1 Tax=Schistosoma japonicum TaxID=6182 RepID=Q5D9U9_SCHJA|nr:SJCHGC03682 protein [Schistosoma japonicum]